MFTMVDMKTPGETGLAEGVDCFFFYILKWEVGLDCVASGAECEGDKYREILAPKFDIWFEEGIGFAVGN